LRQDQRVNQDASAAEQSRLLSAADVRRLAARYDVRPTKTKGQNFVIDPNTVRRIVAASGIGADDIVLEVGPGLGSLTLALLPAAAHVIAVEIDPVLAAALPTTVAEQAPGLLSKLTVIESDALDVHALPQAPTALVANLPYNVAVPVLLELLARFPSLHDVLVMVQAEVADRLAAEPGSKVYGVPSVKARWYGNVARAGAVGTKVFWPEPRVDSGLVRLTRHDRDEHPDQLDGGEREQVFAVVDAAFAQRRKTLRAALAAWAGSADRAERVLVAAGIEPRTRGEQLDVSGFVAIARAAREVAP
jgi:16S rRNA (adenine1518-N6/adenine1519-N6)-dimethyltransferase